MPPGCVLFFFPRKKKLKKQNKAKKPETTNKRCSCQWLPVIFCPSFPNLVCSLPAGEAGEIAEGSSLAVSDWDSALHRQRSTSSVPGQEAKILWGMATHTHTQIEEVCHSV